MKWMVLVIFGGMGLAALIGGLMWGAKRVTLFRNGLPAQGKVVEISESVSSDDDGSHVSYYPVVEFQTRNGETFRFKGSTGSSSSDYETGATVRVRYNPKNPRDAQLANFSQFWLGPVVITAAGLIALFLGIGSFIVLFGDDNKGMFDISAAMQRQMLSVRSDAVRIEGRITGVRGKGKDKYVFVCKGLKPGASFEDEFESDEFDFNPGPEFAGRAVTICLDPYKKGVYSIEFGLLLEAIVKKQSR